MARKLFQSRVSSGDLLTILTSTNNSSAYNNPYIVQSIKQEIEKLVIRPRFRICILNEDESVKIAIPHTDIVLGGSYNENYQSGQRRSLSFSLYNELRKYTPSINTIWANTKMSYEMGLELDSGDTLWFPKGIYNVNNIGTTRTAGENLTNVELGDKYSVLEGALGTYETSVTIPVDTEIEGLIYDLLNESKGNGERIDPKPFIYHSSFKGARTQATITQSAGSNRGDVLQEIGTQLNAEVFYDVQGQLNVLPISETTNDIDKPIIYQLYDENGDFGSDNLSFDMSSIVNRVVVIGANINGEVCEAFAVNNDPSSPLCYQRIGYRTASPINDSNITSSRLAQERADYELRQKLLLRSSVSHDVTFNPLLLVNNLIGVTDNFYNFQQEKFLIQSISASLDYSGRMSISSANARNFPFVVGA